MARIVTLPGDGIGPEVLASALEVLRAVADDLDYEEHAFGGASIDAHGTALTDETLAACRGADAVLLAAVGGPKWDTTDPDAPRPEQGLLGLRKGLGLYANLRPVRPIAALLDASPLKRELIEGTDLLVVRELTGGIYFGDEDAHGDRASDLCVYSVRGDRADRPHRVRGRALARDERRQGERAGDVPAVARGRRRACTPRSSPTSSSSTMLVDTRAMQLVAAPAPLRRDPHREHVRRHPQRRGGDAHRLARDAARAPRSAATARACSSPSTARRPTSRARAWPTRWR